MTGTAWTAAQDELLRKLWDAGKTATYIAAQLHWGKSRNAVVGRAHRLGLPGRESPIGKGHYPGREIDPDRPVPKRRARRKNNWSLATPKPRAAPVVTRPGTECRWTDSTHAPWVFCGKDCQQGFSWCPEHKARVFQPKPQAAE